MFPDETATVDDTFAADQASADAAGVGPLRKVTMAEGSPDFYEWTDRDLQVYIAANLFALRTDVAVIKQLAGEVAGQAAPIIEKVQSSPLLKMLGVR